MTDHEHVLSGLRSDWKIMAEGKGGHCPVCDRYGKVYGYSLTGSMIKCLVRFAILTQEAKDQELAGVGTGWVDFSKVKDLYLQRFRAQSKLKWFDLLDQHPDHNTWWRTNDLSLKYLHGSATVPHKVFVYDDTVLGISKEVRNVQDAKGRQFSVEQVMDDMYSVFQANGLLK